jgi:hypothetical protein
MIGGTVLVHWAVFAQEMMYGKLTPSAGDERARLNVAGTGSISRA